MTGVAANSIYKRYISIYIFLYAEIVDARIYILQNVQLRNFFFHFCCDVKANLKSGPIQLYNSLWFIPHSFYLFLNSFCKYVVCSISIRNNMRMDENGIT